jgi:hypothetical protein
LEKVLDDTIVEIELLIRVSEKASQTRCVQTVPYYRKQKSATLAKQKKQASFVANQEFSSLSESSLVEKIEVSLTEKCCVVE